MSIPTCLILNPKRGKENISQDILDSYQVIGRECLDDLDYAHFLIEYWNIEDIIIVEHDIEVRLEHLKRLIECQRSLCAYAYYVYPVTTRLPEPVLVHRVGTEGGFRWLLEGEEEADLAGLGLAKIGLDAQGKVDITRLTETKWFYVNHALSMLFYAQKLKWHIHYPPVEHAHKEVTPVG